MCSTCYAQGFGFGGSIVTGKLTIDAGSTGTGVVLSADETICRRILITPLPSNTFPVYIGNSSANATPGMGYVITGDAITQIDVRSTNSIYMDATVAGEGISWIAIIK